jgi:hypothetical protein
MRRSPVLRKTTPLPFAASLAMLLASQGATAQSASAIQPFSGRYEGRQKVAFVTATAVALIELRRSSHFIVYTMQTTVNAPFIERRFHDCSVMRIEGERLLPVEYVHRDESDPEKDIRTRFDWPTGSAKTLLGQEPEPKLVALDRPTWDPLSFQVALIALARDRQPGTHEEFRVIERGVLKEHDTTFVGRVATPAGKPPQYEIVSHKSKGFIALRLLPDEAWRPARVTVDGVTVELVPAPVTAPAPLPEDGVPRCESAGTP